MFGKKTLAVIAAVTASALTCGCEQRPDSAQDLIDAFASSCASRGSWTDSAIAHTNAFINVLNKVKTAGPCASLLGNLSQIQSLNGQLSYLVNSQNFVAYNYNQQMVQELTLALEDPSVSPTLYSSLNTALVNAESQTTLLSASAGTASNQANAMSLMATSVQSLVGQAGDLSYCFNESPAAALMLATNAMAVGGSFISPMVGAGVATLGSMLNGVIMYVKNTKTNAALWKAHSAKMPLALTCGLETMTRLYCQADDALDLIEYQRKNYPKAGELPSAPWTGLDILGRRLPVLTKWLQRVKTGTSPSDENEAKKQIAIWEKIQAIENADINVQGVIHGATQLYSGATTDSDRHSILANMITAFANYVVPQCSPGSTCWGPLKSFSSQTYAYACWLVDGYRDVGQGTDPHCPAYNYQGDTLESYVRRNLVDHADIRTFESNWRQIYQAAYNLADIEFSQTITLNPGELLRQAYAHPADNVSPHQVFILLRDYISSLLAAGESANPNDAPVMQQTLKTVTDALALIEDPSAGPPQERVRKLVDLLDLKNSARAFLQLIQEIVSTDTQNRLDRGEMPSHVGDILRSAGVEIRSKLLMSGIDNLSPVVADINSSRDLTESNVSNFRSYFLPSIAKAIKALDKAAHPSGVAGEPATGVDRPHGQVLAKLCMLVISTGTSWPDKATGEICSRQTLYSLYSDGQRANDPLTIGIGELEARLRGKSNKERYCTYYKYARAERLAEVLERQSVPRDPNGPSGQHRAMAAEGGPESATESTASFDVWSFLGIH